MSTRRSGAARWGRGGTACSCDILIVHAFQLEPRFALLQLFRLPKHMRYIGIERNNYLFRIYCCRANQHRLFVWWTVGDFVRLQVEAIFLHSVIAALTYHSIIVPWTCEEAPPPPVPTKDNKGNILTAFFPRFSIIYILYILPSPHSSLLSYVLPHLSPERPFETVESSPPA